MNENARAWIAALRSGEFEQTREVLTRLNEMGEVSGHCCLGVACVLYDRTNPDKLEIRDGHSSRSYDSNPSTLPPRVMEWLGLSSEEGSFTDGVEADPFDSSLAEMNDSGASFEEIAAAIEEEPPGLFRQG